MSLPVQTPSASPSPIPLMQLATSFWAFKTLATAVELDLFTRIARSGSITVQQFAEAHGFDPRPAEMLLTGCASLGLLQRAGAGYANTSLADEFLVRDMPYYFGGFVTMLDKRLYSGWDKLPDAMRHNRPTTWDPSKQTSLFDGADPQMMATFWQAMHSLSTFTARTLADAVDLSGFRKLLDVGGGSAAFDIELCRKYPNLSSTVYDLPFVTDIASQNIRTAGMEGRVTVHPGDFFAEPQFPAGHDAILFSMIMHDWNEEQNRELLRKAHDALPVGGIVIISELLVNDEKSGPPAAALMSLNMLVETEGGRNYTPSEYRSWLTAAGFGKVDVRWFDAAGANGAVIGYKI
jgi:3-hydroxy-5-methyl-1-naphthoate 3-O-methyltransferase